MLLEKSLPPADPSEAKDTQPGENIIVSVFLFAYYKIHNFVTQLRDKIRLLEKKISELTQILEDRTNETEGMRKKLNRDASVLNGGLESSRSNSSKPEPSIVREEVAGLKLGRPSAMYFGHTLTSFTRHIVQELQKENLASAQQIKLLESENRLLSTEAEQLRQV